MPDYKNGKIYKLWSPEGDDIYIGSTTLSLARRKSKHKCDNTNSTLLFEKYTDVRIELLEECPCDNKEQLHKKEGEYIRNNKCVNERIPKRTNKEWQQDNKEHLKIYVENNKEHIKQKHKEWYENNIEKIKEQTKDYYKNNKEKKNQKAKERNSIEFVCECGITLTQGSKARHQRSKRHIDLMEELKK